KDVDVRQQPPSFLLRFTKALPLKSPGTLELVRQVQFAYSGDFWANHELASALKLHKRPAEAVTYYTAALALRPNNPGVYVNRSSAMDADGKHEAAIRDLHMAISLAPRYAVAHHNLGRVLARNGDMDGAVASFQKAITINPKLREAHRLLAVALAKKGNHEDA